MKHLVYIFLSVILILSGCRESSEQRAQKFIDEYTQTYQQLYYEASKASWLANTDISDEHTNMEIEANKALVNFQGQDKYIEETYQFLSDMSVQDPLIVKQLEAIYYNAANGPQITPQETARLVEANARQNADLYSFEFKLKNGQGVTPNEIDRLLREEKNVQKRLEVWTASKEVGKGLKDGLAELQQLRNKVSREMGYDSFFAKEVSDYGMSSQEMVDLMDKVNSELKPLYAQLYTWVKHELAKRYKQPVPDKMPAHWLPNRWSQEWPGIVESVNLDPVFAKKEPQWLVQQAERFYVSMGFPQLPPVFWEKSDLYPSDGSRKKNTHASAWHLDIDKDVRSLMSVESNRRWFETTHHELGHIYYYLSYTNPNVPVLLREGANRGFHEGIGELISIASMQTPYLQETGLLENADVDKIQWLLNEALSNVVFIPWAAGVMTHFEYELYEKDLPKEQFNKRWWELVEKYQGIVPPAKRGEEYCDAASKTHINNDPAQYYDYAVAKLLQYQFHDYICANILNTSPHEANYYNSTATGQYLQNILAKGKTQDWRKLLQETTGEELSARAMLAYFEPLMDFLKAANKGRKIQEI